jgi:hypothetical protein
MLLEGSCHCRGVRFKLRSIYPYPFNLCYCSICRKTSGGGDFAINLRGDYSSLKVEGEIIHLVHIRPSNSNIRI